MKKLSSIPLRIFRFILFIGFYFKELFVSSILLAWDIVRPHKSFKHGIVGIDLDLKSDTAIIALSNLLSMTPGSLSVELTPDRKRLYVHSMYLEDPEAFKLKVKNSFERKIKQIFE
jgi:multicomponent Na+:H+ antiporter subunit E